MKIYKRYLDEEKIIEMPVKEALEILSDNYSKLTENQILEILHAGCLYTPGAKYSFLKGEIE